MSKSFNVTLLSKEYERIFDKLDKNNTKQETTGILNDMLLVALVANRKKIKQLSWKESLKKVNEIYPFISFSSDEIFEKNKTIIEENYLYLYNLIKQEKNLNDFEKMLGSVLEKHINRKATGSYYTPEDTTNFICWNSILVTILNMLSEDIRNKVYTSINISNNVEFVDKKLSFEEKILILKNSLSDKDIKEISSIISKLKIVDPTCGSGAFIISAYECIKYLNENLLNNKLNKEIYYKNIYGVDIVDVAVMFSRMRIIFKTIIDNNFNEKVYHNVYKNIICKDALNGSDKIIHGNGEFDWSSFGDFDCIVGNPPYVEVKDKSEFSHFNSVKCGNLYAYAIERACNISRPGSVVSFIVPLPLIATPRMKTVREYLEEKSDTIYYCTFADRPGCLFTGVHQRLTIFFAKIGNEHCRRFTSSYNFWYKNERQYLFKTLDFIENNHETLPKIGKVIENSIFVKNRICDSSIISMKCTDGEYTLYVSSRIGFWAKAFFEKPKSNEITVIKFKTEIEQKVAYCFINSSLFYFLWIINSDCWHITNSDLKSIRFNFERLSNKQINKLLQLANELSIDLEKNKVRINSKQTEFEYKHKYSKKIIDKIDDIICLNAGLDYNETKYIKAYTLKYRLNTVEDMEESK